MNHQLANVCEPIAMNDNINGNLMILSAGKTIWFMCFRMESKYWGNVRIANGKIFLYFHGYTLHIITEQTNPNDIHKLNIKHVLEVYPFLFILLCSKHLLQPFIDIIFYQLLNGFSSPSSSTKYSRCKNMYFFHFLVKNTHWLWIYHSHHINNVQIMFTNVKHCLAKSSLRFPLLPTMISNEIDSREFIVDGNFTFTSVKFTFQ